MSEHIKIDISQGIMSIRFNRPEKKNAITQAMYAAAADALVQAESDSSIQVILIAGTDDCFTAGNDLQDFLSNPPAEQESPVARFLTAISTASKPLIAALEGVAVGIGTTMLLHCDLVYAGADAKLQLPFVNLALVPEAGSSRILPGLMGHQRAAELLFFGNMFSAQRAVELGIVNAACANGDTYAHAYKQAQELAKRPPKALRMTKELMKRYRQQDIQEQMQAESVYFSQQLSSPEAREAMQAFMERRPADFSKFS